MRDPVRDQLDTIRAISERLLRDHRTVTDQMMRALTPQPSVGGDAPADADVELTGVEAATLRRIRSQATQYQFWIERALAALEPADVIRGRHVAAVVVNTAPKADSDRCGGGADDWADPTCERLSVCTRWHNGTQLALCDACDRRRRRYATRAEGVA